MGCTGSESWPDKAIYNKCPICGEATERFTNLRPMDEGEAQSLKLHAEFETFYERRCAGRNVPHDGPLPDDYELDFDGDDARQAHILTMLNTHYEPTFVRALRPSG